MKTVNNKQDDKLKAIMFSLLLAVFTPSCILADEPSHVSDIPKEPSEPVKGDGKVLPQGFLDASKISIGELSKMFDADLTEKSLIEKIGKPSARDDEGKGQIRLKYFFSDTGLLSGKSGFYIQGMVVFFDRNGKFVIWQLTYEQIENL